MLSKTYCNCESTKISFNISDGAYIIKTMNTKVKKLYGT